MNTEREQGAGSRGQGADYPEQGARSIGQALEESGGTETFENLEVWKDAIELAAKVYDAVRDLKDFEFRRQIQGAALSISSNIAEGYERDSNTEFVRFLFIAKGSCGEVRSQAQVALKVGLLDAARASVLIDASMILSRRLMRLIQVRRDRFD